MLPDARALEARRLSALPPSSATASPSGRIGTGGSDRGPSSSANHSTPCHAPCFQPMAPNSPTRSKPSATCSAVDAGFGCVIPATARWNPWRRTMSSTAVIVARPRPRPANARSTYTVVSIVQS